MARFFASELDTIQLSYEQFQELSQVTITSTNNVPDCDPKDWQLVASNDRHYWILLNKQSNINFQA